MLSLQATVYAFPENATASDSVLLRGLDLSTISGDSGGPPAFRDTLPVTFEQMQQRLLELDRCDCEPDGFFLLTGHAGDLFWRLNGHMHEHQGRLHRVELNGECPVERLERVLRTMGWPEAELAFQLVQEGVTLAEADFRRWAAAER